MGAPTSSCTTDGIALRVSGALKPHHHDKEETPSVGKKRCYLSEIRNHPYPKRGSLFVDPSFTTFGLLFIFSIHAAFQILVTTKFSY
jgi:hypothetical protein